MEVVSLQFGVESVGQVSPRLCLCAACDWTSKECSAIDPHAHLIHYKLVFIFFTVFLAPKVSLMCVSEQEAMFVFPLSLSVHHNLSLSLTECVSLSQCSLCFGLPFLC